MPITLLDVNDHPCSQQYLEVNELPGAVLLGDRVFFRWADNVYRETPVLKLVEA